jgi:urease accessory protein
MIVPVRSLLAAALVLTASPALAHPPPLGIGGFFGGLLHPLLVPAHLLALLGLSLLIGQQAEWSRAAPLATITALAAGLGVMTLGFVPLLMSEALLALAVATGLLVVLARALPEAAGCVLAGATGLAIALDSPPEAISVREANFMLIGTGFGATILLILAIEGASRLRRDWRRTLARILGSWVAASAMLALALRFFR